MLRTVRRAGLALVVALSAAACRGSASDPTDAQFARVPDETASIEGVITERTVNGNTVVILVEGTGEVDRARVTVRPQSRVLRQTPGGTEPAGADELTVGTAVRVWFTGPVAESYPVQATAGTVLIL